MNLKLKTNIDDLFREARQKNTYLKVCAPMVRYSKLEFRMLTRKYGTDLCFTPMIMANSFCQSELARLNEFGTTELDGPLIAQFAANNSMDFLSAAEMVYPYVDGIDLNCGCPQRWAIQSGHGCALLNNPELITDFISTVRRNLPTDISVSVKIRLQNPLKKTVNLCHQLEHCGVTFISIHGRTPSQKINVPVDIPALKEVKQSIHVPLIVNGDVRSLSQSDSMFDQIQCDGVMSARGILSNPTLFSGLYDRTPLECVQEWLNLSMESNDRQTFQCFHHHLTFMMEKMLRKRDRVEFNNFTTKDEVILYLKELFGCTPVYNCNSMGKRIVYEYDDTKYKDRRKRSLYTEEANETGYNTEDSQGKYFLNEVKQTIDTNDVEQDWMGNLFDLPI